MMDGTSEADVSLVPLNRREGMMATEPVSFETDVKPMFRERDRSSMEFAFDLWDHDDVSQNADAILDRLKAGTMPCDGAWPADRVAVFRRWIDAGKPA